MPIPVPSRKLPMECHSTLRQLQHGNRRLLKPLGIGRPYSMLVHSRCPLAVARVLDLQESPTYLTGVVTKALLGAGLLEPGEVGISSSNRNFPGRMGARTAQAYLASAEVVAASALRGTISGPDGFKVPADWSGVEYGYGTGLENTTQVKLGNIIQQLDSLIDRVESVEGAAMPATDIVAGFLKKITGEILFCDADNISTDALYPGRLTYQNNVSQQDMAQACTENYDPSFDSIARPNDILVG